MKQHIPVRYVMAAAMCVGGWIMQVPLGAQGIVDQIPPEIDISRAAGQSVQPFFEGWERNSNGTISMWFGYLNRNAEEEVDVPVGGDNKFEPGGADQGQPTHFLTNPRRRMFVFKVNLPRDWDKEKKLVWTVTAHGKTNVAYGWMQREWEVDNGVREENGNGITRGAPHYDPPNQPPTITGSGPQTVAVGQPLKLTATANDDGIPKPRPRPTVGPDGAPIAAAAPRRPEGLFIRWIVYRAPETGGQVSFSEPTSAHEYGKPVESKTDATFSAPGTYWLQAIANDGSLDTMYDVKVTVTGHANAGGGR
jgi:hypothetical protein